MTNQKTKTVVVAGATGTVGRYLAAALPEHYRLVGLTRDPDLADASPVGRWKMRLCDLYSRADTFEALRGADYVVYLAHTARPSARLTQASAADLDLLCADNVARAAAHHGIEQIAQMQSLLHESEFVEADGTDALTQTLGSTGVPVTTFVTDIVVGVGGTAVRALRRLVERLPAMVCPSWTTIPLRVIDASDAADAIASALGQASYFGQTIELTGPEKATYIELLEATAAEIGKKRWIVRAPTVAVQLSALWVAVWAGLPLRMMRHFVLQVCRRRPQTPTPPLGRHREQTTDVPYREALRRALVPDLLEEPPANARPETALLVRQASLPTRRAASANRGAEAVRSVQRLPLPAGRDAAWAAAEYNRWLPKALRPLMRVDVDDTETARFYLRPLPWPLLVLRFAPKISKSDRQLYWISGGLLAADQDRGRLEFRSILGERAVLAAIHEFRPALPWFIYRFTQALVHLWVMRRFARHLKDIATSQDASKRKDAADSQAPSESPNPP